VIWVLVFAGIALAGLVMVISYAVWLFHKASDVMSEVRVLADRGGQLAVILGDLRVPQLAGFSEEFESQRTADGDLEADLTT
jgi:hypothetical protein